MMMAGFKAQPEVYTLERVKGMFEVVAAPTDPFQNELEMLKLEEAELIRERKELLGIERVQRDLIDARIDQIRHRVQQIGAAKDTTQAEQPFRLGGYDTWMSLQPLMWRHPDTGMPPLALFSLKSSVVEISLRIRNERQYLKFSVDYPQEIQSLYGDMYRNLPRFARKAPKSQAPDRSIWWSLGLILEVSASTQFSGIIPSATREKIRAAEATKLFSQIYILAEVDEWKVNAVGTLKVDPIVVGWSGRFSDRLWYIHHFDITPLENGLPFTQR